MLDKKYGAPTITNDGVTIAREIELEDAFDNQGAPLRPRDVAADDEPDVAQGDGTTTATLLAQAIVRARGCTDVAAGAEPDRAPARDRSAPSRQVVANLPDEQSAEVTGTGAGRARRHDLVAGDA